MAHQTYNDLTRWIAQHPQESHMVHVVATDQVHLVCLTCGFECTADAVDAGLPVTHEED